MLATSHLREINFSQASEVITRNGTDGANGLTAEKLFKTHVEADANYDIYQVYVNIMF